MTKEVVHEARIYCDGCGCAVVESAVDYIDRAFEQCGWLHTTTQHGVEMDYCPVCRADSPFEAVQRVRELHRECISVPVSDGGCAADEHDSDAGDPPICLHCTGDWPCATIRALDGSDD